MSLVRMGIWGSKRKMKLVRHVAGPQDIDQWLGWVALSMFWLFFLPTIDS